MKKKILALALVCVMALCAVPTYAYSVREAYSDIVSRYPGFVENLLNTGDGVSEGLIIEFLGALQRSLYNKNKYEAPITEENFDNALVDSVMTVITGTKYIPLQNAILNAYPEAVVEVATKHTIPEEFEPIYESVKTMVFEYNMLEEIDTSDSNTVELVSVTEPDSITVSKGDTLSLPQWVEAKSETGATVRLQVNWTDVPETSAVGTYTAKGTIVIPDGFTCGSGFPEELSLSVTVEADGSGQSSGTSTGSNKPVTTVTGGDTSTDTETVHKYSFSDVDEKTEAGKAIYALTDAGVINGYPDSTFKPANGITRAEFVTMIIRSLDSLDGAAASSFTDVAASDWFYAHVSSAVKQGLVKGYEDNSFRPSGGITRAEVMTIICRALDAKNLLTEKTAAAYADDSQIPAWAKDYVYALAANKIVSGDKDNKIRAEEAATREDCAVMLYNALKLMNKIK